MAQLVRLKVYCTVLVVMAESAIEGVVSCYLLTSDWGDPGVLTDSLAATSFMDDLRPLFSAICEYIR